MNTLFDKIWDRHVVQMVEDGPTQLYIDRLYCHEVTTPQAFDGLRARKLRCFRPNKIFCMPDHNTPTHDQDKPIQDPVSRAQVEALERNSKEFGLNYFGIMSYERIKSLTSRFKNSIIDNSQAFFARALETSFNIYSARKFIGVPDGAYVLGDGADKYLSDYPQGYSSDTSAFLLQRIEYGCEGKAYESRMLNEKRIDGEDVSLMSALTRKILDGTDYESIIAKRKENFSYACKIFADINKIDPLIYYDDDCVPMVYPLVCEDDSLLGRMLEGKHFQGHWWSYLLDEMDPDSFEYYLSRYIIPVTVDQRYGKKEIDYIRSLV